MPSQNVDSKPFVMNQNLHELKYVANSVNMSIVSKILKITLLVAIQLWYIFVKILKVLIVFDFFNFCDFLHEHMKIGTATAKGNGKWLHVIFLHRKKKKKVANHMTSVFKRAWILNA